MDEYINYTDDSGTVFLERAPSMPIITLDAASIGLVYQTDCVPEYSAIELQPESEQEIKPKSKQIESKSKNIKGDIPGNLRSKSRLRNFKKKRQRGSYIAQHPNTYRKQLFSKQWLCLPEFKDWLGESVMIDKASCCFCRKDITAGKSELQRHAKSRQHIRNTAKYLVRNDMVENNNDEEDQLHKQTFVEDQLLTDVVVTKMIDVRNDSVSLPSKDMKTAMLEAPTGDVSFNTDKTVRVFESKMASLLGKEAALFFPTHIMANFAAVLAYCRSRGSAVIFGNKSDICLNNQDALVRFGGLFCSVMRNEPDGSFCLNDFEEVAKSLDSSSYFQNLVCIESPHKLLGGVVPPSDWICQLSNVAKSHNMCLHCDGTRLANSSIHLGLPLANLVSNCNSVTFAIDKCLGAPLGAVVAGPGDFIMRCKFIRNSIGGHIHQAGIFASAGIFALSQMPQLEIEHNNAWTIAVGVSKLKSNVIWVDVPDVHTNVVHLKCNTEILDAKTLVERLTYVSEVELDKVKNGALFMLSEAIDDETVALMLHKDVADIDARNTVYKLKHIISEYEEMAEKQTAPRKRKKKR